MVRLPHRLQPRHDRRRHTRGDHQCSFLLTGVRPNVSTHQQIPNNGLRPNVSTHQQFPNHVGEREKGLIQTIKLLEDENGKDGFSLVRINNKFAEEITNMPFLQCFDTTIILMFCVYIRVSCSSASQLVFCWTRGGSSNLALRPATTC